ncbi:ABC transporter permease subunit [Salinarchaeum laminariae]|uniref:ABC transporter permease subunit n=1 Tax=Salinarchaeum laminariae TaxID=869888 RepID=UPI0020C10408|nr:ABC transporter permease subunit [Salinarchaeum laminariae]
MSGQPGWLHVAKKDLQDSARSKLLLGVIGVLLVLSVVLSAVPYLVGDTGSDGAEFAAALFQTPIGIFLPVLAAMIGYMAIVQERESGSIRVLLGLPLRRSDVVVGKVIGRSIVIVGALLVTGLIGTVLMFALYGSVEWQQMAAFGILGGVLSVVYVAVAIAVSASVSSRGKAMGLIVAILLVLVYAYQYLVLGLVRIVEGSWTLENVPDYALLLLSLDPNVAGSRAAGYLFSADIGDPLEGVAGESAQLPFYAEQWTAFPVIVLWIVVPLAIGYYRFGKADL